MANTFNNSVNKAISTTGTQIYSGSNLDATGDVGIVIGMLVSNTGTSDTQISAYHVGSANAIASVTDSSGLLITTSSGHGMVEGDSIVFTTTGTFPTNITAETVYYVKYVNTTTFKIATTSGGTAVAYSAAGSNTSFHSAMPLINQVKIPTNTSLELCRGNKFVVKKDESLHALRTGGTASTAMISILEITS